MKSDALFTMAKRLRSSEGGPSAKPALPGEADSSTNTGSDKSGDESGDNQNQPAPPRWARAGQAQQRKKTAFIRNLEKTTGNQISSGVWKYSQLSNPQLVTHGDQEIPYITVHWEPTQETVYQIGGS